MSCPRDTQAEPCSWCQTDQLVAGCPDLIACIEQYCRNPNLDRWQLICGHLGGQCASCSRQFLARCEGALSFWGFRPLGLAADDLRQEILRRALQANSHWQPAKGPLGGWLHLVARRLVADAGKSAYSRVTRLDGDWEASGEALGWLDRLEDPGGNPAAEAAKTDLKKMLFMALDQLPFDERRAVSLRFVEGNTLQNISRAEGIPLTTLCRRLANALDKMRAILDEHATSSQRRTGGNL